MMLYSNPILEAIRARADDAQTSHKIAIHEAYGRKISYADLQQSVEALAQNLVANGFQQNDRVLMLVRPNIATLQIVLAVVRAGGVLVIADPAMGQAVFQDRVALAQPRWVFVEDAVLLLQKTSFIRRLLRGRGIEIPEIGRLTIPHIISVGRLPFLGTHRLTQMMQATKQPVVEQTRPLKDDITIVFTSGTTGKPKGVVHTLKSMLATIERVRDYAQLTSDDVVYDTGILFIIPALMAGATVVMGHGRFDAAKTVQTYRDYGVTKTLDVPRHMKAMLTYLQHGGEILPDTLQDVLLGAAPVFADFLQALQSVAHPNTRIWSIYGMTELLPAALVSLEDKLDFDRAGGDLVGAPMAGLSVRIADDGELLVQGDGLYDRYLGQAAITEHHTGDMARLDEQGRIVLLGRKKDMIIRGKHNIYPPLFEPLIRQIEGVRDCAMVGVYNPSKADEDIVLFIEAETPITEKQLRQLLLSGEYSIDLYAQPDHILFATLPYSGRSLKLDKKALRQQARQQLGIADTGTASHFER
ncbi:MAG: class I adenylate-forming enzyme family protein [Phototrophicaceae bacterium]